MKLQLTVRPEARARRTRPSTMRSPGPGAGGPGEPRNSTKRSISTSASLAASVIEANALVAPSGSNCSKALAGAGLYHHEADAVGDDVVELAGDPGPLIAHRGNREHLPLFFQLAGTGLELGGQAAARAHHQAPQPGSDRHHLEERVEAAVAGGVDPDGEAGQPNKRRAPSAIGAETVGDEEDGKERRQSDGAVVDLSGVVHDRRQRQQRPSRQPHH